MDFAENLVKANVTVNTQIFPGKSHTDFFLEDLMEGIGEDFEKYLLGIIHGDPRKVIENYQRTKGFAHPLLVKVARIVNPF